MKTNLAVLGLGLALALSTVFWSGCSDQPKLPPIYNTQADGAKLIADALVVAERDQKRVLVEFGANWCIWCHRLHALLTSDPEIAPYFDAHFLLVLVDVDEINGRTHNENLLLRYGEPTKDGLPGLVLLESDGHQLKTQDSAEFMSGDHFDPAKLLKFLKDWTLKAGTAN